MCVCVCVCGDQALYWIGCYSFQIWSLMDKPRGVLLNDLSLHGDWVTCVLYSPSGLHILSASDNGVIKVDIVVHVGLGEVSYAIITRFYGMKMRKVLKMKLQS